MKGNELAKLNPEANLTLDQRTAGKYQHRTPRKIMAANKNLERIKSKNPNNK